MSDQMELLRGKLEFLLAEIERGGAKFTESVKKEIRSIINYDDETLSSCNGFNSLAQTAKYVAKTNKENERKALVEALSLWSGKKFDPSNFIDTEFKRCGEKDWTGNLLDYYHLRGLFKLTDIANFVRKENSNQTEGFMFAVLDDPDQATYTSGHSVDQNDLDVSNDKNIFFGDLDKMERFKLRLKNLLNLGPVEDKRRLYLDPAYQEGTSYYEDINNRLFWGEDTLCNSADIEDKLPFQTYSYIQIVPVAEPAHAIAAFPNGYFIDDFGPFENFLLARDLFENFGFQIFGLGATYAGFYRNEVIQENEAVGIGNYLHKIACGHEMERNEFIRLVVNKLLDKNEFYLAYGSR